MSAGQDHLPRQLWWLLAGLRLAGGFNWTAMKVALADVSPWTFRSLCLGFGSAVLFLALRMGGQRLAVPRGRWPRLAQLAFFNITCWNVLIAFGMTMIPSGRAAILAYTMPDLGRVQRARAGARLAVQRGGSAARRAGMRVGFQ
ncbi:MAG: EamA family transporter [Betaproteobacteria bacterium]